MDGKLRMACSTRCKIAEHIIRITGNLATVKFWKCRSIFTAFCKIKPSLRGVFYRTVNAECINVNEFFYGRRFRERFVYMMYNIGHINGYNHLYVYGIIAVNQIFFCKHVGCRNGDCTEFVESHHGNPEFITALKNQHYKIAVPDSLSHEKTCSLIRQFFHFAEADFVIVIFIVCPDKGRTVRLFLSQDIHYIIRKVKVLRYFYFIVINKILIRFKFSTL